MQRRRASTPDQRRQAQEDAEERARAIAHAMDPTPGGSQRFMYAWERERAAAMAERESAAADVAPPSAVQSILAERSLHTLDADAPELLADGEDWRSPLIERRVSFGHEQPVSVAPSTIPAGGLDDPLSLQRRLAEVDFGAPPTPSFMTPAKQPKPDPEPAVTMAAARQEEPSGNTERRRARTLKTPGKASRTLPGRTPNKTSKFDAVRSPVLQLRTMLSSARASSVVWESWEAADVASGGTAGLVSMADWRAGLLQPDTDLTAAQVDILETIAVRGGTVRYPDGEDDAVLIAEPMVDYRRFGRQFGLAVPES